MKLLTIQCGITGYRELWRVQKTIWKARVEGEIPDVLLLTEHRHVYTLGKTADPNHLVASEDFLQGNNVEVVSTDRGGGITYHGPGQLVVYPIISLESRGRDLHWYLRTLEESIIGMLASFGVAGEQDPDYTGVWVSGNKIASIGIKVSRWVTMHGAAINVSTDLEYFSGIIACGIFHKGLISLSEVLGKPQSVEEAAGRFVTAFCSSFEAEPEETSLFALLERAERTKEPA